MDTVAQGRQVAEILKTNCPHPKTELFYSNEMQLAIAVMLSAQTTDKKVNQITPGLFAKFPTWQHFADADIKELQNTIRGVNFHLGKADRLIKAAKVVLVQFGGKLPHTMAELTTVPGIARKSANVIMQELWDTAEGIVVDTHVTRVAGRLGLTTNTDPVKIERDLMMVVPRENWRNLSGAMVLHGRYVCTARNPKCEECVLNKICPSAVLYSSP